MRAVIIGGGAMYDYTYMRTYVNDTDYVICADHGLDHCLKMGLTPDIVIGDLDSVVTGTGSFEVMRFPERKDFTDSELAVRYALEKGYRDIVMLAFLGTRMDHTVANIGLLSYISAHGGTGMEADEHNEIRILTSRCEICGSAGDIVSIIPIGSETEDITTDGLEYPLYNETLRWGECRGVSNVMTSERCTITCGSGAALVIKSKD